MKTIEPINMEDFSDKAKRAQAIATDDEFIQYDFNGITCTVSPSTDIKLLLRDYINAGYLENKSIGPDCLKEVSKESEMEMAYNKVIGRDDSLLGNVITAIYELRRHYECNPTTIDDLDYGLLQNAEDHCRGFMKKKVWK